IGRSRTEKPRRRRSNPQSRVTSWTSNLTTHSVWVCIGDEPPKAELLNQPTGAGRPMTVPCQPITPRRSAYRGAGQPIRSTPVSLLRGLSYNLPCLALSTNRDFFLRGSRGRVSFSGPRRPGPRRPAAPAEGDKPVPVRSTDRRPRRTLIEVVVH